MILRSVRMEIKEILDEDTGVSIPGFGTFVTYVKKKRKSFNPYHKKFMMERIGQVQA